MVHALEQVRKRLVPDGVLIDIHPAGEMPPLFLRTESGQSLIGWFEETDYFIEYRHADQAIARAVSTGLFKITEHREFIFETQAKKIAELQAYLAANWSDSLLEEKLVERANRMQQLAARPSWIVLAERVQIFKLEAVF